MARNCCQGRLNPAASLPLITGTGRGSFDAVGEVRHDHEMDTERSDEYERPALAWLLREVTRLNSYLMEAGVSGREQRRAICNDYFFGFGDAGPSDLGAPLDVGGQNYVPAVAFATADERLLLATDMFDFHEYARSIVSEALGDTQ